MKKVLLLSLSFASLGFVQAQKDAKKSVAYAITGVQKGSSAWTEVRLVDLTTGEELQTIYASSANAEILNARTGKAVVRRDAANGTQPTVVQTPEPTTRVIHQDGKTITITARAFVTSRPSYDQPFATTSAACAYDKKFNRLYYTPMGIAELRYIDLKAKQPKVYYFQDEAFGVVKGKGDVSAQITRMVIAPDGYGYALSNDGNHLVRFSVKKKPDITDLGPLTDDATNGRYSVHSGASYGGDMVADKQGNLWLITANRSLYKIGIESKTASFVGNVKGLPRGFSTNGMVAEGGSTVIVSSSGSTEGYYRVDLNSLQAEKLSGGGSVFNASDLANDRFAFEKQKDEDKPKEEAQPPVTVAETKQAPRNLPAETLTGSGIGVYPNPVTNGYFNLSFADQKAGRYQVQLLDVTGKVVSMQQVIVQNKVQVEEFRLPKKLAAGNYLVRVTTEDGAFTETKKLIVQ